MRITPGPETPGASVAPEAQSVPVEVTPTPSAEPAAAVDGLTAAPAPEAPAVAPPVEAPPAAPLPEAPLAPVTPPPEAAPAVPPTPDAAAHMEQNNFSGLEESVGGTSPSEKEQNVGQLADQDAAAEAAPVETPPPEAAPEIGAETDLEKPLVAPSVERTETRAVPPEILIQYFRSEADNLEQRAKDLRKSADDLETRTNREAA